MGVLFTATVSTWWASPEQWGGPVRRWPHDSGLCLHLSTGCCCTVTMRPATLGLALQSKGNATSNLLLQTVLSTCA